MAQTSGGQVSGIGGILGGDYGSGEAAVAAAQIVSPMGYHQEIGAGASINNGDDLHDDEIQIVENPQEKTK